MLKTVTIVEVNHIEKLPPAQNLIRVLLADGYRVNVIGSHLFCLAEDIRRHQNYQGYELPELGGSTLLKRQVNKLRVHQAAVKQIRACMKEADYLWTMSMETTVILGKEVLKYRNIMQLMELAEHAAIAHGRIRIPLDGIARRSWKNVAVERNRAYIQQVWWNLPQVPAILPNKPFSLDYGDATPELEKAINKMKEERKKIIFYLGVIGSDRDLVQYARAIHQSQEYAMYVAGRSGGKEGDDTLRILTEEYNVVYLGAFNAPKHLALVQYAYVGLLPYKPVKMPPLSDLNALYCAPNKIWEYAGFGVPMVGSDVLGLKLPFEQWNIGRCSDTKDEKVILQAIEYVDAHHDEMSTNCYKFYDSVDLHKIVADILAD